MGFLTMRMNGPVTHVPALGTLFLLWGCRVQLQYDSFCFILLHFVMLVVVSWQSVLLKGNGVGGVDLGGAER